MPKLLIRIVVILLLPSLIGNQGLAAGWPQPYTGHTTLIWDFREQAIVPAVRRFPSILWRSGVEEARQETRVSRGMRSRQKSLISWFRDLSDSHELVWANQTADGPSLLPLPQLRRKEHFQPILPEQFSQDLFPNSGKSDSFATPPDHESIDRSISVEEVRHYLGVSAGNILDKPHLGKLYEQAIHHEKAEIWHLRYRQGIESPQLDQTTDLQYGEAHRFAVEREIDWAHQTAAAAGSSATKEALKLTSPLVSAFFSGNSVYFPWGLEQILSGNLRDYLLARRSGTLGRLPTKEEIGAAVEYYWAQVGDHPEYMGSVSKRELLSGCSQLLEEIQLLDLSFVLNPSSPFSVPVYSIAERIVRNIAAMKHKKTPVLQEGPVSTPGTASSLAIPHELQQMEKLAPPAGTSNTP